MKLQGKIINWNDDKGFGFVEPNGGGQRAFVHIKAFTPRSRRPVNGDVISYELALDNKRYKADKIKFAQSHNHSHTAKKPHHRNIFGTVFTAIFWLGLAFAVFTGRLPLIIGGLYILMSCVAFIAYAMDKSAAQNGRWRTQESTLHFLSFLGGWPGALLAQNQLRHKSSKAEFKSAYKATVMLNLAGLYLFFTDEGMVLVNNIIPLLMKG